MNVCVFSTVNEIEAGMVKTALDAKGINNYLQNSNSLAYLGASLAIGNMEVYVEENDADKAIEIIKALFENDIENTVESANDQFETEVNSEINNEEVIKTALDSIPRKRAPFATIWLFFSLLFSIYQVYDFLFPDPILLFKYYAFWYICFVLGLPILGIAGIILILKWKKIGFWMYTGVKITDALFFFIFTYDPNMVFQVIMGILGIGVMYFSLKSKNEYDKSTWEQLK